MSDAASLTGTAKTARENVVLMPLESAPSVVVAIPTFRRPESLLHLLRALELLHTTANVTVLVADNDGETREGFDLCAALRLTGYRWLLDSIVVPERGIAQVRNALVARILTRHPCDFVAMIDDDEWPAPEWLDEFLRVQKQTGADALQGTIKRVFEKDPGGWTVHCDGVSDAAAPTGPIAMLQGAGNLLVRRDCLERLQAPWFDPAFGATGGEDADFLVRIKAQGARFAWAHEALAYDRVPPSRANLKWALKRAYSTGNSDMRVFLKHRPSRSAKIEQGARIVGALLLSPPLFLLLMADRNRRVKPLRKLYRAFGKIAAIGGRHYNEYSVIHGR
ncbi:MAG TPA: glycosyltransferase family 2 protein [Rhizomicrobium sp.]